MKNLNHTKDSGPYKCTVSNANSKKTRTATIRISVTGNGKWVKCGFDWSLFWTLSKIQYSLNWFWIGENSTFINITTNKSKIQSILSEEVNWHATCVGNPVPKVIWRDNHGNDIPMSSTENRTTKFEATQRGSMISLKIRRPTIADVGYYILWADNGKMTKTEQFELIIKGNFHFKRIFYQSWRSY